MGDRETIEQDYADKRADDAHRRRMAKWEAVPAEPDPEPETCECHGCGQEGIPLDDVVMVRHKPFCMRDGLVELAQVIAPALDDSYTIPPAELDRIEKAVPDLEELLYTVGEVIRWYRASGEREQRRLAAAARDENGRCLICLRKKNEAHTMDCRPIPAQRLA